MSTNSSIAAYKKYKALIEEHILDFIPEIDQRSKDLYDAMKYSLLTGGKRIRPVLVMAACDMFNLPENFVLPNACAIEYIHTYSLIHDDLPCMDDDDFRRGQPSCHKKFGEEYALLAGDGLLTLAFETALKGGEGIKPENKIKAVRTLAELAGIRGMVGGQVIDLQSEGTSPTIDKLHSIDRLKTGALIKASVLLGCYAANITDDKVISGAVEYAECIGLAFQIVDDILDITSDSETLGKPVGSDVKNDKITYVSLMGIDKAKQEVDALTLRAVNAISDFPENTDFLKDLALKLANRNK